MLSATDRGLLDKIIDETKDIVSKAPMQVRWSTNEKLDDQRVKDFTLGWAMGFINGEFISFFTLLNKRSPDEEEWKEAGEVMRNRETELKEAISKA
jgi:hypothetical protein